jgi:hypothetical protein
VSGIKCLVVQKILLIWLMRWWQGLADQVDHWAGL